MKSVSILIWIVFLCLRSGSILGQDWFFNKTDHGNDSVPAKYFLQTKCQYGGIANTNTPGVSYIESNPYQAIDFRYGVYGNGKKEWQQLHHFPTYGLGIGKYFFQPQDNSFGNPLATYLFFNEPLIRFKKSSIGYDFSMGLAFPWKPYDPQSNPDQLVIGSTVSGYLGLGAQYDFKISNRLDGIAGINLSHFSNGRIRSPNRGLNLYGLSISVRYRLGIELDKPKDENRVTAAYVKPAFKPFNEFYMVGSIGVVTTFQDKDNPDVYYMAGSLSIDAARHYGFKGKYGIGLDWSYDESLKVAYQAEYPNGVPDYLLYWPGVHLSHEYMIHRWTLITQAGINLKTVGDKGLGYGRIAFRYDLSKSLFLRIGIRAYKNVVSDFLEWGVGYTIYQRAK